MPFISSFEIINVVTPDAKIFLWTAASVAGVAADNPNDTEMLLANGLSTFSVKGTLSGLWQFVTIENPLKMMKNGFSLTSKVLSVIKIFKSLSWLFGHVTKQVN